MSLRSRWIRGVMLSVAVLGLVTAAGYAVVVRPMFLRGEQVANLVDLRMYRVPIDEYWARHGSYPESLGIAVRESEFLAFRFNGRDRWGHEIRYRRVGQGYLMISYGSDGLQDGTDYECLRELDGRDENPCKSVAADIIFSDRGEHRTCGK